MQLPIPTLGASRQGTTSIQFDSDGIEPQRVKCKLDLTGQRTKRVCTNRPWGGRWCVNVPEGKEGQCREHGRDCTDCYSRCRDQFTSAGGWTIRSEWGRECDEV